jgi:hypothetical protein
MIFSIIEPIKDVESGNPCVPSPCGPYSVCRDIGDVPACSCLQGYVGRSPNCRPECVINAECPGNLACFCEKCTDPCPGSCGSHALCQVVNHVAQCSCYPGYHGDPYTDCVPVEASEYCMYKICMSVVVLYDIRITNLI